MGIGVTNLGHCHPAVNEAAKKQIDLGVHLQVNCVTSPPMLQLAEKFGEILPAGLKDNYQVLFSNSGAESVENAVKLARHATKKQTVIVFQGGFHGRTIATGALTTAKYVYRAGFQPTMGGVHVAPYPYCVRCPVSKATNNQCNQENCCQTPLDQLRLLLTQQTSGDEVAAILVEPVQGEGGYIVPPASFLQGVRKICDEIGALMIVDEVQSGFGRTGTMFAVEQFDITPDIMVVAKGIANGFPVSAIITRPEIMSRAKPGSIGGTYTGNAVACAASVAVIDTFKRDNILANVNARGQQFRAGLKKMQTKYPILDVRGLGLMNAVEFKDEVGVGFAGALTKNCVENGLLVLSAGVHEALRFVPALTISAEEVDQALAILDKSIGQTLEQRRK